VNKPSLAVRAQWYLPKSGWRMRPAPRTAAIEARAALSRPIANVTMLVRPGHSGDEFRWWIPLLIGGVTLSVLAPLLIRWRRRLRTRAWRRLLPRSRETRLKLVLGCIALLGVDVVWEYLLRNVFGLE
jgi:hypothetical protein